MGVYVVNKCFNHSWLKSLLAMSGTESKGGKLLLSKSDKGRTGQSSNRKTKLLPTPDQRSLVLSYFGAFDFIPILLWLIPKGFFQTHLGYHTLCLTYSLKFLSAPWKAHKLLEKLSLCPSVQAPNRTFRYFH